MSSFPSNYVVNLHQVSLTVVWNVLLSVSIVSGIFRYDKIAAMAHMIFGWIIFIYSIIFMLIFLVPFGFNITASEGWVFYSHGIVGVMIFGLVPIQLALGMAARYLQQGANTNIQTIRILRMIHRFFGYLLYITYNVLLLIQWYPEDAFYGFIAWDCFWVLVFIFCRLFIPSMQYRITDPQTNNYICPSVGSIKEVKKVTENYVIFANYVYDARNFEK